ncbi:MAG: hypothetical protein KatS3mg129_2743 [Leptospiraceae bacterium]|nr:MAG: hypothetical protein KatS3mg129_2743 [Leptospiraceae bacterium]
MEFIILTIIFCFYVLYNEIHKRKIKNQKKEFKIPKEFYENLKDTIQYIDYTLESIKQKQENINKIYIKLLELKKELEEKQLPKKRTKKTKKNDLKKDKEEVVSNFEDQSFKSIKTTENSSFIEKILEEIEEDKIEFSFREKEKVSQKIEKPVKEALNNNTNFVQKLGSLFRRVLNIPDIPITLPSNEEINLAINAEKKPISLEEFELNIQTTQIKKETDNDLKNKTEQSSINEKNSIQFNQTYKDSSKNAIDPKEILLKESKKLFLELKTKEEKIKFINKLIDLGFNEDEIHYITDMPPAEILLISKLRYKKG